MKRLSVFCHSVCQLMYLSWEYTMDICIVHTYCARLVLEY